MQQTYSVQPLGKKEELYIISISERGLMAVFRQTPLRALSVNKCRGCTVPVGTPPDPVVV